MRDPAVQRREPVRAGEAGEAGRENGINAETEDIRGAEAADGMRPPRPAAGGIEKEEEEA